LTKNYCDLMCSTQAAATRNNLLERAMACVSQALEIDPKSHTAHACIAVCYSKASSFAYIKTTVAYSCLIKKEAEEATALNPKMRTSKR